MKLKLMKLTSAFPYTLLHLPHAASHPPLDLYQICPAFRYPPLSKRVDVNCERCLTRNAWSYHSGGFICFILFFLLFFSHLSKQKNQNQSICYYI